MVVLARGCLKYELINCPLDGRAGAYTFAPRSTQRVELADFASRLI